jgi:hypothetical protein
MYKCWRLALCGVSCHHDQEHARVVREVPSDLLFPKRRILPRPRFDFYARTHVSEYHRPINGTKDRERLSAVQDLVEHRDESVACIRQSVEGLHPSHWTCDKVHPGKSHDPRRRPPWQGVDQPATRRRYHRVGAGEKGFVLCPRRPQRLCVDTRPHQTAQTRIEHRMLDPPNHFNAHTLH